VIAIDCDRTAFEGEEQRQLIADHTGRLIPVHGRFGDMATLVSDVGEKLVDGILLDLGVSSPQLDIAERGFSFRPDLNGPLDMRMDQSSDFLTAAYVVNNVAEEEIARIIYEYGEERQSRRIARAICNHRRDKGGITTTQELASIVRRVLQTSNSASGRKKRPKLDPATRTFMALRTFVNDELNCKRLLRPPK